MSDGIPTAQSYETSAIHRDRRTVLLLVALSCVLAVWILSSPPGWYPAFVVAFGGFIVATWVRPVFGLGTVLGLSLLFEQYDFAYFTPITREVPFFENVSVITGIDGLEFTPLEILLVVVSVVVLVQVVTKARQIRENPLALPVFVFVVALGLWFFYGLVAGGAVKTALWELRALAYFCLLAFVVPQVIAGSKDVSALLWIAIVAVGVKAVQGAWNYFVVLARDMTNIRSVTGHEDALFMAWMAVLAVALLIYRSGHAQKVALIAVAPVSLLTFVVTDRRAAYAALVLGLMTAAVLVATDPARRRLVVKIVVPVCIAGAMIVVGGWNAGGVLGRPADIIRSIVAPESQEDIDSSYYRAAEEVNLIHAIESSPLVGIGFGRQFQASGQGGIVDIGYTLADYIAHNQIIWLWAKMGTIGFAVFWTMMGGIIAFGCLAFRTIEEPYLRSVALLVVCAVVMQLVVSYVDMQLTYARNMVFLGTLVGLLSRLPALDGAAQLLRRE